MADKFLVSIPPFFSWDSARAALVVGLQKLSDYLVNLPPKTEFGNKVLSGLADPVNTQDAATKNYVDGVVGGIDTGLSSSDLTPFVKGRSNLLHVNYIPKIFSPGILTESAVFDDGTTVEAVGRNVGINAAVFSAVAGRSYYVVKGTSLAGCVELQTGAADGDTVVIGLVQATDINASGSEKRAALINFSLDGTTANNRGGRIRFFTRGDGTSTATERVVITQAGRLGAGGNTSPGYSIDTTGDTNTSGVFRVGGTAGVTTTVTLAKLTTGGANGSLTITGGIITAVVNPT